MVHDALKYLASSKTVLMWLVIALLGFVALLITLAVLVAFGVQNPYLNDFYNLLTGGGIGGTIRNVISDGVMPRIPQAVGAAKDPQVAIESPQPMVKNESPASYIPPISTYGGQSS